MWSETGIMVQKATELLWYCYYCEKSNPIVILYKCYSIEMKLNLPGKTIELITIILKLQLSKEKENELFL
jgi:hypothetical protein